MDFLKIRDQSGTALKYDPKLIQAARKLERPIKFKDKKKVNLTRHAAEWFTLYNHALRGLQGLNQLTEIINDIPGILKATDQTLSDLDLSSHLTQHSLLVDDIKENLVQLNQLETIFPISFWWNQYNYYESTLNEVITSELELLEHIFSLFLKTINVTDIKSEFKNKVQPISTILGQSILENEIKKQQFINAGESLGKFCDKIEALQFFFSIEPHTKLYHTAQTLLKRMDPVFDSIGYYLNFLTSKIVQAEKDHLIELNTLTEQYKKHCNKLLADQPTTFQRVDVRMVLEKTNQFLGKLEFEEHIFMKHNIGSKNILNKIRAAIITCQHIDQSLTENLAQPLEPICKKQELRDRLHQKLDNLRDSKNRRKKKKNIKKSESSDDDTDE